MTLEQYIEHLGLLEQCYLASEQYNHLPPGEFQLVRHLEQKPAFKRSGQSNIYYHRTPIVVINASCPLTFIEFEKVMLFILEWGGVSEKIKDPFDVYYMNTASNLVKLENLHRAILERDQFKAHSSEILLNKLGEEKLEIDRCCILDITKLINIRSLLNYSWVSPDCSCTLHNFDFDVSTLLRNVEDSSEKKLLDKPFATVDADFSDYEAKLQSARELLGDAFNLRVVNKDKKVVSSLPLGIKPTAQKSGLNCEDFLTYELRKIKKNLKENQGFLCIKFESTESFTNGIDNVGLIDKLVEVFKSGEVTHFKYRFNDDEYLEEYKFEQVIGYFKIFSHLCLRAEKDADLKYALSQLKTLELQEAVSCDDLKKYTPNIENLGCYCLCKSPNKIISSFLNVKMLNIIAIGGFKVKSKIKDTKFTPLSTSNNVIPSLFPCVHTFLSNLPDDIEINRKLVYPNTNSCSVSLYDPLLFPGASSTEHSFCAKMPGAVASMLFSSVPDSEGRVVYLGGVGGYIKYFCQLYKERPQLSCIMVDLTKLSIIQLTEKYPACTPNKLLDELEEHTQSLVGGMTKKAIFTLRFYNKTMAYEYNARSWSLVYPKYEANNSLLPLDEASLRHFNMTSKALAPLPMVLSPQLGESKYHITPVVFKVNKEGEVGEFVDPSLYFNKLTDYDNLLNPTVDTVKNGERVYRTLCNPVFKDHQLSWSEQIKDYMQTHRLLEGCEYRVYQKQMNLKPGQLIPLPTEGYQGLCSVRLIDPLRRRLIEGGRLYFYRHQLERNNFSFKCSHQGVIWVGILYSVKPHPFLNINQPKDVRYTISKFSFDSSGQLRINETDKNLIYENIRPALCSFVAEFRNFKDEKLSDLPKQATRVELANQFISEKKGVCAQRAILFANIINQLKLKSVRAYVISSKLHARILLLVNAENRFFLDLGGGRREVTYAPVPKSEPVPLFVPEAPYVQKYFPLNSDALAMAGSSVTTASLVSSSETEKANFKRPTLLTCRNFAECQDVLNNLIAHASGNVFYVENSVGLSKKTLQLNFETGEITHKNSELIQTLVKPGGVLLIHGNKEFLCTLNPLLDQFKHPVSLEEWLSLSESSAQGSMPKLPYGTHVVVVMTDAQYKAMREDFGYRFEQHISLEQLKLVPILQARDIRTLGIHKTIDLKNGLISHSKLLLDSLSGFEVIKDSLLDALIKGCYLNIINPPRAESVDASEYSEYCDFQRRVMFLKQVFINGQRHELGHNLIEINYIDYDFSQYSYTVIQYHSNPLTTPSTPSTLLNTLPEYDLIVNESLLDAALKQFDHNEADNTHIEIPGWLSAYKDKPARILVATKCFKEAHFDWLLSMAKEINCSISFIINKLHCPLKVKQNSRPIEEIEEIEEIESYNLTESAAVSASGSSSSPSSFLSFEKIKVCPDAVSFVCSNNLKSDLVILKSEYPDAICVHLRDTDSENLFVHWEKCEGGRCNQYKYQETDILKHLKLNKTVIMVGNPSYGLSLQLALKNNQSQCVPSQQFSGKIIVLTDLNVDNIPAGFKNYISPSASELKPAIKTVKTVKTVKIEAVAEDIEMTPSKPKTITEAIATQKISVILGGKHVLDQIKALSGAGPESESGSKSLEAGSTESKASGLIDKEYKIYNNYEDWIESKDLENPKGSAYKVLLIPFADINPDQMDYNFLSFLVQSEHNIIHGSSLVAATAKHRVVFVVGEPCELTRQYSDKVLDFRHKPVISANTHTVDSSEIFSKIEFEAEDKGFILTSWHRKLLELLFIKFKHSGSQLGGVCIEGPSQIGKTKTVKLFLECLKRLGKITGYVELIPTTEKNALKSLNLAYENGLPLVIDELNTLSHMKVFWVQLIKYLMDYKSSGSNFFIFATQNPTSFPGRSKLPDLMLRYLFHYRIPPFAVKTYTEILMSIDPDRLEGDAKKIAFDFIQALQGSTKYKPADFYKWADENKGVPLSMLEEGFVDDRGSGSASAASSTAFLDVMPMISAGAPVGSIGFTSSKKRPREDSGDEQRGEKSLEPATKNLRAYYNSNDGDNDEGNDAEMTEFLEGIDWA